MKLELINNDLLYEIQNICLLFFPREGFSSENGKNLSVILETDLAKAILKIGDSNFEETIIIKKELHDCERTALKRAAYSVLNKATGITSPWGILTGIRPALYYQHQKEIYRDKTDEVFINEYLVTEKKLQLCIDVSDNTKNLLQKNRQNSASLYISIPFCPSRCKYCSFVSGATAKERKYIPEYLQALKNEIIDKSEFISNNNYDIMTVYIGGGTPTVLETDQLKLLFTTLHEYFVKKYHIIEYTVEAGRPDTITEEKLAVMQEFGVNRISVNPQTLNDDVLKIIGRNHNTDDFYKAYLLAQKKNFTINVDLIAGLPDDNIKSFENSFNSVMSLSPENITLHTLYLKRAADFGYNYSDIGAGQRAAEMVDYALEACKNNGYLPYYMYRQKNTVGNLENIGFAKKGY
ncbi:MAG: hemZ, partial [Clostridia bacterium]|nr:hemZ [Clostridia bacterium]